MMLKTLPINTYGLLKHGNHLQVKIEKYNVTQTAFRTLNHIAHKCTIFPPF